MDISCRQYRLQENTRKYDPLRDIPVTSKEYKGIDLCWLPIMLRSQFCNLNPQGLGKTDRDLTKVGECTFDQGGYFVINGSEKVRL